MSSPGPALRIAIAQSNPLVGDIAGNTEQTIVLAHEARDRLHADLIVFPELNLTGYPPEDLLLRPGLYPRIEDALRRLRAEVPGIHLMVGYPHRTAEALYNACAILADGRVIARYFKQNLPNYGVFDEKRYFTPGMRPAVVAIRGVSCGLTICEDIWVEGPVRQAVAQGAHLILNQNASPYHLGRGLEREAVAASRARANGVAVVYANLVGGQDELVFDGGSFVVDRNGETVLRAPAFEPGLHLAEIDPRARAGVRPRPRTAVLRQEESIYRALVMGVGDYVRKNTFRGAVVGLSGGIDSALTLAIAVDALGASAVEAVLMPSRYTAQMSLDDAILEAETLGITHRVIPIEAPFQAFLDVLSETFSGTRADTTEENIQARCRGTILMAISNKTGRIVLTTGNKSEMAVGYATLYGDMAGGFAPLKDVPKTMVYALAEWRNRDAVVIPQRVLERPPSAELAPDQRDEDSLPPYSMLDPILERYVEQDRTPEEIVADGFPVEAVERVVTLVNRNEYKRRQAAPGVRISRRAFGRDRRYPITSGYDKTP